MKLNERIQKPGFYEILEANRGTIDPTYRSIAVFGLGEGENESGRTQPYFGSPTALVKYIEMTDGDCFWLNLEKGNKRPNIKYINKPLPQVNGLDIFMTGILADNEVVDWNQMTKNDVEENYIFPEDLNEEDPEKLFRKWKTSKIKSERLDDHLPSLVKMAYEHLPESYQGEEK